MERIVIDKEADFLIQVKSNAPQLQESLERVLQTKCKDIQTAESFDKGHGRIEARKIEIAPTSPIDTNWPHTHTVCRVTRDRQLVRRGELISQSHETSMYVASFSSSTFPPERIAKMIRGHWTIENVLHHRKDRSMDEDRCRASECGIGRVMCCIRSITALVLGRAKESLSVIQRRFSRKTHLVIQLLSCRNLHEWEQRYKPYKLACRA